MRYKMKYRKLYFELFGWTIYFEQILCPSMGLIFEDQKMKDQ